MNAKTNITNSRVNGITVLTLYTILLDVSFQFDEIPIPDCVYISG